jgi:hypothetical protein
MEWKRRDWIAAAGLFVATAAVVLWQNAHLVVLWDLSYVLDSAARMALGQMPYRDFPFAHAPLTFLMQAAIIRWTGRVFFHHVVYCAVVGGLGTVAAWRIVLGRLRERKGAVWAVSVVLAAALCVLGLYCILPHPSYDCDCIFAVLVALLLLQRVERCREVSDGSLRALGLPLVAGAAAVLPLFFKQNIGLVFLAGMVGAVVLLLGARWLGGGRDGVSARALLAVLAGAAVALIAALLLIEFTTGLGNYVHWTIGFAAQRRMPGLTAMVGVYQEPRLLWMLPCVAAGVALLRTGLRKALWARVLALGLLAAPFVWTLVSCAIAEDADDRTDSLLALWPLLLVLSAVLALVNLRRGLSLRALLPAIVLATINGTLMSQQLWGSTYAIWPLLMVLVADLLLVLDEGPARAAMAAVIAGTLLVCGGVYVAGEERLSYAQFLEGVAVHTTVPALAGMATPGPFLPEFEELLRFAAVHIPASDGVILIPGEDPFYFATGRTPRFPVLLWDPATDPYPPDEVAEEARARGIRWLIVKRNLQIKADMTPQREDVLRLLLKEFKPMVRLEGYDVYRRP